MLIEIFIISILILINGIFTCAELAMLSVKLNKIKLKADAGNKKAILLLNVLEKPDTLLSTIQIVVTTSRLFVGAYSGYVFAEPIVASLISGGYFSSFVAQDTLQSLVVIFITIILSYFTLVFAELVPKKIALNNSEKVANIMIHPIIIFSKLCKPFIIVLSFSSILVFKILGIKVDKEKDSVTEEEIRMLVDAGGKIGNIDADERQMINNIFEFNDITAEEISTHRTNIVSLNIEDTYEEIIKVATNDKHSRIPVYEDNIDNIIGVLHIKDIMKYIINNPNKETTQIDIRNILREPYFVPTSKKADELFEEMKNNKIQFSIVIDEYGGTVGIVTMEDLIEEVMGNIFDEYDGEEVPEIDEVDQNTFIINGTTSLEDVSHYLNAPLPIDEYDTIGGFVIGQLGRIPNNNEQPEVEFGGLIFKVKGVYEKRIQKVVVCKVV